MWEEENCAQEIEGEEKIKKEDDRKDSDGKCCEKRDNCDTKTGRAEEVKEMVELVGKRKRL